MMSHSLGQHGLATPGRSEHEHAPRRINAYLFVQLKMSQRQLDGLAHLLLLQIQPANVHVAHVGLLIRAQHCYARVGLGWEDVDEGVRVFVQSNGGAWL